MCVCFNTSLEVLLLFFFALSSQLIPYKAEGHYLGETSAQEMKYADRGVLSGVIVSSCPVLRQRPATPIHVVQIAFFTGVGLLTSASPSSPKRKKQVKKIVRGLIYLFT